MNLSDKFLYKLDNKVPALSADMPNLNQIITAAQPTVSNDREINLTVNLTSLMDGQEVAKITEPYTTKIQRRNKEIRDQF